MIPYVINHRTACLAATKCSKLSIWQFSIIQTPSPTFKKCQSSTLFEAFYCSNAQKWLQKILFYKIAFVYLSENSSPANLCVMNPALIFTKTSVKKSLPVLRNGILNFFSPMFLLTGHEMHQVKILTKNIS